jgi:copper chaperone CopZ
MKFALALVSILLSLNVFASNVEVDINGMTCGMCVDAITRELKATEKAERVSVKLEEKKATFGEVKGKKLSDSEIRTAIKKAGYEVVKIRRY